jgi:hypothetical protein
MSRINEMIASRNQTVTCTSGKCLLLQVAEIALFDVGRLFIRPGYPIMRTSSGHLLQQPARLDALHRILGILVRFSDSVAQLDDPLFLRIAARIVRRVGLKDGE